MTLPDLIAASGATPVVLAARTGGLVSAARWEALATRPYVNEDGTVWRPVPGIVAGIAEGLRVTGRDVRDAIRNTWPTHP